MADDTEKEDIINNDDDDSTVIKKRGRPSKPESIKPGGKPVGLTVKDIQQKVFLLYDAVTPFLGKEKQYAVEDFDTEAKSVFSICEKWPLVASIISMADPIFIVLLLLNKFTKQKNKPVTPAPEAVENGQNGFTPTP